MSELDEYIEELENRLENITPYSNEADETLG